MESSKIELILGSQSPRRKELIGWLDIPYQVVVSDVEEKSNEVSAIKFCEDIARLKGQDVWTKCHQDTENPLVVSADTMVFLGDEKLGKPKNRQESRDMLDRLSGQSHKVITSVFMKNKVRHHTFSVESHVTFDSIDEVTRDLYVASGEGDDKAGSYGIQGKGLVFISRVEGSYANVVGFPLSHFKKELLSFLELENSSKWRSQFV